MDKSLNRYKRNLRGPGKIIFLLAMATVASCGLEKSERPVDDAAMSASVIYRGDYCPEAQPAIRLFGRAEAWNDWHEAAESTADTTGNVDFASHSVIVIAMGEKPSSGYSVDLSSAVNAVVVRGDILTIDSIWRQPSDDDVVAQVITSPCLAISVPKSEFNVIRIIDESGEILLEEDRSDQ